MATKAKIPAQHYHAPLIHVGATRDSVEAVRAAIHDILTVPGIDNATRVAALSALTAGCGVTDTTISNCSISAGATAA